MGFEAWLLAVGKSERSAKSYSSAVSGVISTWAMDAGITDRSLMEVRTAQDYLKLVNEIKKIEIFRARNTKGNGMYSSALNAYASYLADVTAEDIQDDITEILCDPATGKTEKATLVNARVGQGVFRQQLINQWQGCAVTGYKDSRFLIASHIKPWKMSDNQERLDPYNGLLLLPNLDKSFDLGFVTFESDGRIKISKELERGSALGIKTDMRVMLNEGHLEYMDYHRDEVFEKGLGV